MSVSDKGFVAGWSEHVRVSDVAKVQLRSSPTHYTLKFFGATGFELGSRMFKVENPVDRKAAYQAAADVVEAVTGIRPADDDFLWTGQM